MKKLISIVAVSILFLTGCGTTESTNLGAQDFQAKAKEAGIITLDVRTSGEFMSGHIENAINIDVEAMNFDSEIAKLDKSATYAVYCRSGRRSQIAVDRMKDAGFTNLFNLNAGVEDWVSAGLPLVSN
jgi:rhodanese-related sulfurtransferase